MTIVNIKKNDKTCIINYTGFIVRILLAIISINSYAQVNLVPNPGFENNTGCPSGENQLYLVNDWYAPTDGIPEYFHTCNIGWWGIPQNIDGYENTQKGEAYVGIYTFYLYFNYGCDYLQTELLDTLEHGNTYYVEFFISLADSVQLATKNIGAYFSIVPVSSDNTQELPYIPQIIASDTIEVTKKNGWSKISGTFIAQGGEKYITIGNFNPDTINADTIFVGGGHPTWMCAYYYIDEVLVMLDTTTHVNLSESKLSQIKIYPNPTKEFIYIETKGYYEEVGFELYDIYNTLVLKQNLQNKKIQRISLQSIRAGVYFYRITSETNIIENGKLVKISE